MSTVVEHNADGVLVIRQLVENTPEARMARRERVKAILDRKGRLIPTVDLSRATVSNSQ